MKGFDFESPEILQLKFKELRKIQIRKESSSKPSISKIFKFQDWSSQGL